VGCLSDDHDEWKPDNYGILEIATKLMNYGTPFVDEIPATPDSSSQRASSFKIPEMALLIEMIIMN
jgi:hypothetical protein